jgi:hypothetical protein
MVNQLEDNICNTSKDIHLQVIAGKNNTYVFSSRHQNIVKSWQIVKNLAHFKYEYLGKAVTNTNLIYKEIKRRFNSVILVPIQSETFAFSSAV